MKIFHLSSRIVRSALILVTMLSVLACAFFGQFNCQLTGGRWIPPDMDEDGKITPGYCVRDHQPGIYDPPEGEQAEAVQPEAPPANPGSWPEADAEGDMPLEQCLAPESSYSWQYEQKDTSEGDAHGGRCRADFVVTNTSDKPIFIMAYDVFDNNAMQDSNYWRQWSLGPGEERREDTSYTFRPEDEDGDTYNYVSRLLAVKKVNACVWLVLDGQEEHWEAWGQEIPTPCQ
jgi:hypothetical protein